MCLISPENHPNFGKSANYQQIGGSAVPLQLRWRPLAAAEAGAAASGAAGMPVRWPRRPAAVSEAVAAGAGPDFSCAAGQKRAAKPPNRRGKVSLGRLCVCVSGSVGRVWSCGRSSPVLVVWGGSPASDWLVFLIFPAKEKNSVGASFVPGCQYGVLFVCLLACLLAVKYSLVRHVSLSSSSSPWLARDLQSVWRVRTRLVVDYARELGVRGALFSLFVAVACFSCLN